VATATFEFANGYATVHTAPRTKTTTSNPTPDPQCLISHPPPPLITLPYTTPPNLTTFLHR